MNDQEKRETRPDLGEILNAHPVISKVILAVIALAVVLLSVLGVVSLVLVFFSVENIEVRGESPYSAEELIAASQIEKGDRLYYLGADKAEKALLDEYPYLKSVNVVSYFPDKAVIEVESFRRVFAAEHKDGYCYLNEELEILEIISDNMQIDPFSIFLPTLDALDGAVGDVCEGEWASRVLKLYSELSDFEYFDKITMIKVVDKRDQYFIFSGKYKIALGDAHNLPEKLSLAMRIYHSDEFAEDRCAVIDVSDEKKVILRYVNPDELSK